MDTNINAMNVKLLKTPKILVLTHPKLDVNFNPKVNPGGAVRPLGSHGEIQTASYSVSDLLFLFHVKVASHSAGHRSASDTPTQHSVPPLWFSSRWRETSLQSDSARRQSRPVPPWSRNTQPACKSPGSPGFRTHLQNQQRKHQMFLVLKRQIER